MGSADAADRLRDLLRFFGNLHKGRRVSKEGALW
jgi:hypothetical protein